MESSVFGLQKMKDFYRNVKIETFPCLIIVYCVSCELEHGLSLSIVGSC